MTSFEINVFDPKYQADSAYKPDKLGLWEKIPVAEDGWVRAHNALRFELSEFKKAIQTVGTEQALESWQVDAVQAYIKGHLVHVHEHHNNEDKVFNPYIKTRVNYPEKLETDHVGLVELMNAIETEAGALAAGSTLASLASLWAQYTESMLPHLKEEEEVGLPLARAFFTPAEIGAVVESFMKDGDPVSMGAFVHVNGSKKANMAFMSQNGIPFFVWYIPGKGFKALRTLYRKHMQSHIDSLVAGRPVVSLHKAKAPAKAQPAITDENALAQQPASPAKRVNVRVLEAQ